MSVEVPKAKSRLKNKTAYSVRASQAVLQYGVGAMVDFRDRTLMTAAPEYWPTVLSVYTMSVWKKSSMWIILVSSEIRMM